MAGLPPAVIERAKEILSNLESHSLDVRHDGGDNGAIQQTASKKKAAKQITQNLEKQEQMTLFGPQIDPNVETLLNKLDASDPERMTPIEALLLQ